MVAEVPFDEVGRGRGNPEDVVVAMPSPKSATIDPGEICVAKLAPLVMVIGTTVIVSVAGIVC